MLKEQIQARLQRWAQAVTIGDGSGYASVCTLSEDWSPPTPGQAPMMKTASASEVKETHRAIGRLHIKLRNAIVVRYIFGGSIEEQAARMECAPETVRDRVERAHAALLREFCNNPEAG